MLCESKQLTTLIANKQWQACATLLCCPKSSSTAAIDEDAVLADTSNSMRCDVDGNVGDNPDELPDLLNESNSTAASDGLDTETTWAEQIGNINTVLTYWIHVREFRRIINRFVFQPRRCQNCSGSVDVLRGLDV
jgi:hypothetical protein